MTAPVITTGTDVLRSAVAARNKSTNLSWVAKEIGVANEALGDFAAGTKNLPAEKLKALCEIIFNGHAIFDEAANLLRPKLQQEPTTLCTAYPDAMAGMTLPTFQGGPPKLYPPAKNEQPKAGPRPGWAA
jgi:hypothetical protein